MWGLLVFFVFFCLVVDFFTMCTPVSVPFLGAVVPVVSWVFFFCVGWGGVFF